VKKPRQILMPFCRCMALTKKGTRCTFKQKVGIFCLKHLNPNQGSK